MTAAQFGDRYKRHLVLPEVGQRGQEKLAAARVLLVGAGGLGSPAALYLAAAGIGRIGLVDDDVVELTNLQRQVLYGTDDIGRSKVEVAEGNLRRLNPEPDIRPMNMRLDPDNVERVFSDFDLILDGTDNLATRYLVNDACVLQGKTLVSAAIHRFEGQIFSYVPDQGGCYRCLFPESDAMEIPNCAEAGVLGVLPGVMGTMQAVEAIKLILGIGRHLSGRLLTYDALDARFGDFQFDRRSDCEVCGDAPSISRPRLSGLACAAPVKEISGADLPAVMRAGSAVLVDVRDPEEFAARRLAGARNIPLVDLSASVDSLPRDRSIVFICASGKRSAAACALVRRVGLEDVASLAGGMEALADDAVPLRLERA